MSSQHDIFVCVADGYYETVESLLSNRRELISSRNGIGDQVLHVACLAKQSGMLGLLFNYGPDVNARGAGGMTPLHYAVFEGDAISTPIVYALLIKGADPSIRNDQGLTPEELAKVEMTRGLGEVLAAFHKYSQPRSSNRDQRKA